MLLIPQPTNLSAHGPRASLPGDISACRAKVVPSFPQSRSHTAVLSGHSRLSAEQFSEDSPLNYQAAQYYTLSTPPWGLIVFQP